MPFLILWVLSPLVLIPLSIVLGVMNTRKSRELERLKKQLSETVNSQQKNTYTQAESNASRPAEKGFTPPAAKKGRAASPAYNMPTVTIPSNSLSTISAKNVEKSSEQTEIASPAEEIVMTADAASAVSTELPAANLSAEKAVSRIAEQIPPSPYKNTVVRTSQPEIPPRVPNKIKENATAKVSLIIGSVFIILSGLIFATTSWFTLSDPLKILSIAVFSGVFFGVSAIAEKKLRLTGTGEGMYIIGCAFLPIGFIAGGFTGMFAGVSDPISLCFALSFIALSLTMFTGAIKYRRMLYSYTSLGSLTGAAVCLFLFCGLRGEGLSLALSIYALAVSFIGAAFENMGEDSALYNFKKTSEGFVIVNTVVLSICSLFIMKTGTISFGASMLFAITFLRGCFNKKAGAGVYPFTLFFMTAILRIVGGGVGDKIMFAAAASAVTLGVLSMVVVFPEGMKKAAALTVKILTVGTLAVAAVLLFIMSENTAFSQITMGLLLLNTAWLAIREKGAAKSLNIMTDLLTVIFFLSLSELLPIPAEISLTICSAALFGIFLSFKFTPARLFSGLVPDILFPITLLICGVRASFENGSALGFLPIAMGTAALFLSASAEGKRGRAFSYAMPLSLILTGFPLAAIFPTLPDARIFTAVLLIVIFGGAVSLLSRKDTFIIPFDAAVIFTSLLTLIVSANEGDIPNFWYFIAVYGIARIFLSELYNKIWIYISAGAVFVGLGFTAADFTDKAFLRLLPSALFAAVVFTVGYLLREKDFSREMKISGAVLANLSAMWFTFNYMLSAGEVESVPLQIIFLSALTVTAVFSYFSLRLVRVGVFAGTVPIFHSVMLLIYSAIIFYSPAQSAAEAAIAIGLMLLTSLEVSGGEGSRSGAKTVPSYISAVALPISVLLLFPSLSQLCGWNDGLTMSLICGLLAVTGLTLNLCFKSGGRVVSFALIPFDAILAISALFASDFLEAGLYILFGYCCMRLIISHRMPEDSLISRCPYLIYMAIFSLCFGLSFTAMNLTKVGTYQAAIPFIAAEVGFIPYLCIIRQRYNYKYKNHIAYSSITAANVLSVFTIGEFSDDLFYGFYNFNEGDPILSESLPILFTALAILLLTAAIMRIYGKNILGIIPAFGVFSCVSDFASDILRHFDDKYILTFIVQFVFLLLYALCGQLLQKKVFVRDKEKGNLLIDYATISAPLWAISMIVSGGGELTKYFRFIGWIMLAACFLLYLRRTSCKTTERIMTTISSLFAVIGLYNQPFFTYPDLIETEMNVLLIMLFCTAFYFIWREKRGLPGVVLFSGSVLSFVILIFDAFSTGLSADAVIIGLAALACLIISFKIRRLRWFILGAGIITFLGIYMSVLYWVSTLWWAYLLIAGLILIAVAALNEVGKRRGEGFKSTLDKVKKEWKW